MSWWTGLPESVRRRCVKRPNRFLATRFTRVLFVLFIGTLIAVSLSLIAVSSHSRLERAVVDLSEERLWRRYSKLKAYYGGLTTLVPNEANRPEYPPPFSQKDVQTPAKATLDAIKKSRVFNPYPDYTSDEYRNKWSAEHVPCSFGPNRTVPEIRVFDGIPWGMPLPVFGSHELLGLNGDVCYDRYGRLGPYGYGYTAEEGGLDESVFEPLTPDEQYRETGKSVGAFPLQKINWTGVDWGMLTKECIAANKGRFADIPTNLLKPDLTLYKDKRAENKTEEAKQESKKEDSTEEESPKKKHHRTAILLRTWTPSYTYTKNDIANMRSLISELTLRSGGEYQVYILLHIRDKKIPIFESQRHYDAALTLSGIPEEFWGITELWSEPMMKQLYGSVHDSAAEYKDKDTPPGKGHLKDSVYDVYRSTFMSVQWWSQRHPEFDYVWNWEMDVRSTGHYYHMFEKMHEWTMAQPREGIWERNARFYIPARHGTWEDFVNQTAALTPANIKGPVPVEGLIPAIPHPPSGVGEPADLINLNTIFDSNGTSWVLRDDITGYPTGTPSRTTIVTASRLSRRLLNTMHEENMYHGRTAFSETFPATVALHHGYKAVYAPHPMYMDRQWPMGTLEQTFNNGADGVGSGIGEGSIYGRREHNFRGNTWYYNSAFAAEVYKAWSKGHNVDEANGRMCLKQFLVHPIKD